MNEHRSALEKVVALPALLGYLNFSEGRPDGRFQKSLSDTMAALQERGLFEPWKALPDLLGAELAVQKQGQSSAFRDTVQAEAVLSLVYNGVLPAYRTHHADLLFHQSDPDLFQPFFLARVFEAVLSQRGPWNDEQRIVQGALRKLNDYVGHRPIAILESRPQGEPYEHERIRPIPLYIKGAGAASGRFQQLIEKALEILRDVDPGMLQEAHFNLELLDELALDPRGYDFGHPADKRPNYIFGEWDPHLIDNQGRYRRYVAREVVLDGLMARVEIAWGQAAARAIPPGLDPDEVFVESAGVLAGTILMACGVSGAGPDTHDSSTTLSNLVPRIARYREAFYAALLDKLPEKHVQRLQQEASLTRQPFGGARQFMNNYLAKHRAWQLQQKHLSLLFAEMGYPDVSRRQARAIPVASIRLLAEMHLRLASGRLLVERGETAKAAELLPEIEDLLRRGIDCGAVVDPWNILGFQGQYLRFTALEDSVRDHRIDEMVHVVDRLFDLYFQVLSDGAAKGSFTQGPRCLQEMKRLAEWWDRFATTEVSDVARVHGGEATASAEHVSGALGRWRERGAAGDDLTFWKQHLDGFNSPKAFALVVDALLHERAYRPAMALLMTWLGQAESVPLEEGEHSFHALALRWFLGVCEPEDMRASQRKGPKRDVDEPKREVNEPKQGRASQRKRDVNEPAVSTAQSRLELAIKFFDYLEANAEDYWHVPRPESFVADAIGPEDKEKDKDEDLYGAAYEDVTYQDSTDDDVEGEVLDFMPQKDFDLTAIAEQIEVRLRFLATLARLWNLATRTARLIYETEDGALPKNIADKVQEWWQRARVNHAALLHLLDTIYEHDIPKPSGSYESVVEYDRRRLMKERLLSVIIGTCLDTALAIGAMQGVVDTSPATQKDRPAWEPTIILLEQAMLRGDAPRARQLLPSFVESFRFEPLLYTPLAQASHPRRDQLEQVEVVVQNSEGVPVGMFSGAPVPAAEQPGHPRQILRSSMAQVILRGLVMNLPRIGLIRETYELVRMAQQMEQGQKLAGPRVTEFDTLFQAACRATVEAVLDSVLSPAGASERETQAKDQAEQVAVLLETITEPFLSLWIEHSKTLRLSALERVSEDDWDRLDDFIHLYGHDLFQPRFLALANLRGILHRGIGDYLDYLRENPDPLHPIRLIEDMDKNYHRRDAENFLDIILQTITENYEEYRDYNATTTQSDYGENLHQLLDFLRLKASYDRNAWQLRPLNLVHDVLARRLSLAADLWREQVKELTRELADEHLEELAQLQKDHGMMMRTVSDRVEERFFKSLEIDRLCAGVEPAMDQARQGATQTSLESDMKPFADHPIGSGLDVPVWLRRLHMEVQRIRNARTDLVRLVESFYPIPKNTVSLEELREQFRDWEKPE